MHKKIMKLKEALTAQKDRNRETEIGVQRDVIQQLLKANHESGKTSFQDLKMKDLRDARE